MEHKELELSGRHGVGRIALIDAEKFELISKYRWFVDVRKYSGGHEGFYAVTYFWSHGVKKKLYMHQLIVPYGEIDHKNHNGLDNRKSNLRACTSGQNKQNLRPRLGGSSQYKGVSWSKQKERWRARIKMDGVEKHLGFHRDEVEAAVAYDRAAIQMFGEYAHLNFEDRWSTKS